SRTFQLIQCRADTGMALKNCNHSSMENYYENCRNIRQTNKKQTKNKSQPRIGQANRQPDKASRKKADSQVEYMEINNEK
ncbi:hypothetical protein KAR91_23970, partial [Candidatus Pacearchaeota archaeon]|nr:hypothetical protein [Candidatus Pacearchaeota archaeon]